MYVLTIMQVLTEFMTTNVHAASDIACQGLRLLQADVEEGGQGQKDVKQAVDDGAPLVGVCARRDVVEVDIHIVMRKKPGHPGNTKQNIDDRT